MIQGAVHGLDLHDQHDLHNLIKEMLGKEMTGTFHGGTLSHVLYARDRDF